jgi:hypothetical protein
MKNPAFLTTLVRIQTQTPRCGQRPFLLLPTGGNIHFAAQDFVTKWMPFGCRWTLPAGALPCATQPNEFTKLPVRYPAFAKARPDALTCPFRRPARRPSWRDAILLPHPDHCPIQERFCFIRNPIARDIREVSYCRLRSIRTPTSRALGTTPVLETSIRAHCASNFSSIRSTIVSASGSRRWKVCEANVSLTRSTTAE